MSKIYMVALHCTGPASKLSIMTIYSLLNFNKYKNMIVKEIRDEDNWNLYLT